MPWLSSARRHVSPRLWLIVAFAAVIALFVDHAHKASLSIDGLRWYWLDDDQMISMRYARNLAEGRGLVWNPGERVEGYTNFGWVMLMALVHALRFGLPDRLMAAAMLCVSCACCLIVFYLAARLLRALEPTRLALTLPAVLLCMVTCTDVMFWAASGFETALVTALHLAVVLQALAPAAARSESAAEEPFASSYGGQLALLVPLSLIPIARSDGMHIWLGDALLVLSLAPRRRRVALALLVSLAPFVVHLVFRRLYYEDWLPNTYYLKVSGLDARWTRGLRYSGNFLRRYWLQLVLAAATAASLWRSDRRARALVTSVAPPLAYAAHVGGDVFDPFRFLAHVMPELFIWGAIGAAQLLTTPYARAAWLLVLVGASIPPIDDPLTHIAPVGTNGDPFEQVVVASELRKNAARSSTVAVIPAGIVPYFTRLKAFDLLGKTDAHIAHLPPKEGAPVGHGKLDVAYTLSKRPDYVISCRARSVVSAIPPLPANGTSDYLWTLLGAPSFRADWEPYAIPDPFMLERSAVFIRRDSPELRKLVSWKGVLVSR